MAISGEWVRFGAHSGYLARPERAAAPMPGIVVIQEAWGVDAHIEDVTRRFAAAGYVALAIDLFAENGERPAPLAKDRLAALQQWANTQSPAVWDPKVREVELAKLPEPERSALGESFAMIWQRIVGASNDLPKVLAAAAWLRDEQPLTRGQKIGSVGFCMGGGLSGLLACEDQKLAASVVFYGMPPEPSRAKDLACPMLGHYAGPRLDPRINDKVPAWADACRAAGKSFEHTFHEGAIHAFFNDGRPSYQATAARDSFASALAFFRRHLAG